MLAKALGRARDKIVMRTYLLGGGFGRRLNGDYAVPRGAGRQGLGKPVKMVCTRADDMRFDSLRSPSVQTLRMAFDEGGKVTAMEHHAAAGWPTEVMAPFFMPKGANGVALRSVRDQRRRPLVQRGRAAACARSPTIWPTGPSGPAGCARSGRAGPTGRWKASWTRRPKRRAVDPVAFRLRAADGAGRNAGVARRTAVGGAQRQAAVLARVGAERRLGQARCRQIPGSASRPPSARSATCRPGSPARRASRVDPATGEVTVEKLTLVVDAGTIVDPDGARAQVRGRRRSGA